MSTCTIEGCGGKMLARGYCNKHYHALVAKPKAAKNACGCGCGGLTRFTFKWGHHTRLFTSEEQSRRGRQNDGSALRDRGSADWYRKVGQRHEHRQVMENTIGRALTPSEIVHHVDENKKNNDPNNLEILTRSEHARRHNLGRKRA